MATKERGVSFVFGVSAFARLHIRVAAYEHTVFCSEVWNGSSVTSKLHRSEELLMKWKFPEIKGTSLGACNKD